jgi:hypothetical protein
MLLYSCRQRLLWACRGRELLGRSGHPFEQRRHRRSSPSSYSRVFVPSRFLPPARLRGGSQSEPFPAAPTAPARELFSLTMIRRTYASGASASWIRAQWQYTLGERVLQQVLGRVTLTGEQVHEASEDLLTRPDVRREVGFTLRMVHDLCPLSGPVPGRRRYPSRPPRARERLSHPAHAFRRPAGRMTRTTCLRCGSGCSPQASGQFAWRDNHPVDARVLMGRTRSARPPGKGINAP